MIEQDLTGATGWALAYGAAAECGFPASRSAINDPGANPHLNGPPVVPPWEPNTWSIFPGGGWGGVVGSKTQSKKMGGRRDQGHRGGPPHTHPPEGQGSGHFWEREEQ